MARVRDLVRRLRPLQGLIKPEHDETGHYYRYEGNLLPSVTTKMAYYTDADLKTWAARLAAQVVYDERDKLDTEWERIFKKAFLAHSSYTQAAAHTGTITHDAIETYLKRFVGREVDGSVDDLIALVQAEERTAQVLFALRSAHKFFEDHFVVPIAVELYVGSAEHGFAGTFDLLAIVDGKLTFVDWKTSNDARKDKYSMQVSAYAKGLEEMSGIKVDEVLIVGLSKSRVKYDLFTVIDIDLAFDAFLAVTRVYDLVHGKTLLPVPARDKEVISLLSLKEL